LLERRLLSTAQQMRPYQSPLLPTLPASLLPALPCRSFSRGGSREGGSLLFADSLVVLSSRNPLRPYQLTINR